MSHPSSQNNPATLEDIYLPGPKALELATLDLSYPRKIIINSCREVLNKQGRQVMVYLYYLVQINFLFFQFWSYPKVGQSIPIII